MEDPNHGFLAMRWFVHNWFVDLGSLFETIVQYLLIRGMPSLGHHDGVLAVSALVCIVTLWTRLTMSHDIRLSGSHDFNKMLHYIVSQPWENIELMSKFIVALTYGLDPKMIIYSLWIGSLWKLIVIGIINRGTMISHGL